MPHFYFLKNKFVQRSLLAISLGMGLFLALTPHLSLALTFSDIGSTLSGFTKQVTIPVTQTLLPFGGSTSKSPVTPPAPKPQITQAVIPPPTPPPKTFLEGIFGRTISEDGFSQATTQGLASVTDSLSSLGETIFTTGALLNQTITSGVLASAGYFTPAVDWWNGLFSKDTIIVTTPTPTPKIHPVQSGEVGAKQFNRATTTLLNTGNNLTGQATPPPAPHITTPPSATPTPPKTFPSGNVRLARPDALGAIPLNAGFSPKPSQTVGRTISQNGISQTTTRVLSGVTEATLDQKMAELNATLQAEIQKARDDAQRSSNANFAALALSQRINNLSSVTISSPTITSASITNSSFSGSSGSFTGDVSGAAGTFSGALSALGGTFAGNLSATGNLRVSGTATSTIAGQLLATRVPAIPHTGSWAPGATTFGVLDASILINPASATADSNLFGIAVGDSVKFLVDAEGDVYARNLTTSGSVTQGDTTITNLTVQDNATFGDAPTDLVTFNANTLNFNNATTFGLKPNTNQALTFYGTTTPTMPLLSFDTATQTVGIGTTSPYAKLSVVGEVVAANFTATSTTKSTFPYASTTALTVSGNSYLGTVSSGIWNGTAIGAAYGGTGLTATPSFGQILRGTGSGYALVATSTLGVALSDTVGTLTVARGGTGVTTFGGPNTLLYTTVADTLASITSAASSILITNGSSVPAWGTTLPALTLGGAITGNSQAITGLSQITVTGTTATSTFATGGLTVGTNQFVVQQNSGNVGIGTSTPDSQAALHVSGGASNALRISGTSQGRLLLDSSGAATDQKLWEWMSTGGNLQASRISDAQDARTTYLTINNSGNVGIGTTSPYAKLSVVGETVSSYFTATTTTATSTFANHISIADGKSYRIGGVPVMSVMPDAGSGASFFAGQNAGGSNTTGYLNTFVGPLAGYSNTSNYGGTFIGASAGYSNNSGTGNTFIGANAGYLNQNGSHNAFVGYRAGYSNISGGNNAFFGDNSGTVNTSGSGNAFVGESAGSRNTTGSSNSFFGYSAGFANTTGTNNIFLGDSAGSANDIGTDNLAIGAGSLATATSSTFNIAIGSLALNKTTWGNNNIAVGKSTLYSNLAGGSNIGMGFQTGFFNKNGNYNILIGDYAGMGATNKSYSNNTYIGYSAGASNTTGSSNSFFGYNVGSSNTTGANNIFLGYQAGSAVTTGSNNIIIGYNIDATSTTATGSLNIGNLIFGTGIDGTGTTLSTGNVGIGTTSPYAKLSVVGSSDLGNSALAGYFTATSTTATSTFMGHLTVGSTAASALVNGSYFSGNLVSWLDSATAGVNDTELGLGRADNSTATVGSMIYGGRSRGTLTTPTIVSNGDTLLTLQALGHDGTGFAKAANINFAVDGTPSASVMPGRITFSTSPAGSQTPAERMRITSAGYLGIGTTSPYSMLSVAGQVVGQNFVATSTTVASTFASDISVASGKSYQIGGATAVYGSVGSPTSFGFSNAVSSSGLAFGNSNTASAISAFAAGINNTSSNSFSVAFGYGNTGSGSQASALGESNIATTTNAVAVGYTNKAGGGTSPSVALGGSNNAWGSTTFPAIAIGLSNTVRGGSYAVGYGNIINGSGGIAIGDTNSVTDDSYAFGGGLTVSNSSMAFGYGITNSIASSLMIGPSDTAKLTILSSGNVGIGTTSPASTFTTVGSACISKGAGATAVCSTTAGTITANVFNTADADVAERYQTTDPTVDAGTITMIDPNNPVSVIKADKTIAAPLFGIVSTQPGFLLGSYNSPNEASTTVPIALSGRVPVKISTENGPVAIGDKITLSSIPGVGMKATAPGPTVGTALEPYTSSTPGTILVFVTVSATRLDPKIATLTGNESSFWSIDESSGRIKFIGALDLNDFDLINVKAIRGTASKWSIDAFGKLVIGEVEAQKVTTGTLCIDDVCVGKDTLRALLEKNGFSSTPASMPTSVSVPAQESTPPLTSTSTLTPVTAPAQILGSVPTSTPASTPVPAPDPAPALPEPTLVPVPTLESSVVPNPII